jgi:hypothetical protein
MPGFVMDTAAAATQAVAGAAPTVSPHVRASLATGAAVQQRLLGTDGLTTRKRLYLLGCVRQAADMLQGGEQHVLCMAALHKLEAIAAPVCQQQQLQAAVAPQSSVLAPQGWQRSKVCELVTHSLPREGAAWMHPALQCAFSAADVQIESEKAAELTRRLKQSRAQLAVNKQQQQQVDAHAVANLGQPDDPHQKARADEAARRRANLQREERQQRACLRQAQQQHSQAVASEMAALPPQQPTPADVHVWSTLAQAAAAQLQVCNQLAVHARLLSEQLKFANNATQWHQQHQPPAAQLPAAVAATAGVYPHAQSVVDSLFESVCDARVYVDAALSALPLQGSVVTPPPLLPDLSVPRVDDVVVHQLCVCLHHEWQCLLGHTLTCLLTLAVPRPHMTTPKERLRFAAAKRAARAAFEAAIKVAKDHDAQRTHYDTAMHKLDFTIAPMPHYTCDHLHLDKHAMYHLLKGLCAVDPSKLSQWRADHAELLAGHVPHNIAVLLQPGGGGDVLSTIIAQQAQEFWQRNASKLVPGVDACAYDFLFSDLNKLGSNQQKFGGFCTTDGIDLIPHLHRPLPQQQQPPPDAPRQSRRQRKADANAEALLGAQTALFEAMGWPVECITAGTALPHYLRGTARPLDGDMRFVRADWRLSDTAAAAVAAGQQVSNKPAPVLVLVPARPLTRQEWEAQRDAGSDEDEESDGEWGEGVGVVDDMDVDGGAGGDVGVDGEGDWVLEDLAGLPQRPLSDIVRIEGTDPGATHYFMGAGVGHGVRGDRKDGGDGAIIKIHGAQYRNACGFTRAARWLERQVRKQGFGVALQELADTGSQYTSSLTLFLKYAKCAVKHLVKGKALYGGIKARRQRLRKHPLKQKQMHYICQCLAFGGTGVKGRWLRSYDTAWRPVVAGGAQSRADIPPVAIVGLGNASAGWGSGISRKGSAPVAALASFFRREYGGGKGPKGQAGRCSMHLIIIDEHRSSKTCSRCYHREGLSDGPTHKLKVCNQGQLQPEPAVGDAQQLLGAAFGGGVGAGVGVGGYRQAQQQHDPGLYVDRDVNAARVLGTRTVYDLVPGGMLQAQQKRQLEKCIVERRRRQPVHEA